MLEELARNCRYIKGLVRDWKHASGYKDKGRWANALQPGERSSIVRIRA